MIKLLIVDDSPTETALLKHIFSSDENVNVIACAKNGREAIELTKKLKPDVITMDIQMPEMGGIESIRQIMMNHPTPIVVISSKLNTKELDATFECLNAGAVHVLEKPNDIQAPEFKYIKKHMIDTVKSMSEIKVIRRKAYSKETSSSKPIVYNHKRQIEVVAIGCSVGGPQALRVILSSLKKDFPVPIVVVQHMTVGFINGFAEWLNDHEELSVKIAEDNALLKAGTVYFAPDDYHFLVSRTPEGLQASLFKAPAVGGFCPSANLLLDSVATACQQNAVGILLTGMGSDGAEGLLAMKNQHALTLIQDEKSCVVFGMGSVAQKLGAVEEVVELDKIAEFLTTVVKK